MFNLQLLLPVVLGAVLVLSVIAFIVVSIYRDRMAPLVREAMNAAYNDVAFLKLNHDSERCDGETLHRFEAACAMFRDAESSLSASQYKRTIELAKQATATCRSLRGRLVLKERLRPFPPSCRIISHPDGLVWMGN